MKKSALVLGGNRFFGRHLALALLEQDYEVTLLNRGRADDKLGKKVTRLQSDRRDPADLKRALTGKTWDLVFDQIGFTATDAKSLSEILKGQTERLIFSQLSGPVNCASPGEIRLSELMSLIEKSTGKNFVNAAAVDAENHSPYGVDQDWTMSI